MVKFARKVEVVTIRTLPQGRSVVVVAAKYQVATGRLVVRGSITLDRDALKSENNVDRLRQLVIFLRWNGVDSLQAVTIEQGSKIEIPTNPSTDTLTAQLPALPPAVTTTSEANASGRSRQGSHAPRGSHIGGKLLVVGGVGAMIGGGVLLAIDEDQNNGSGQVEPTYRESTLAGIVTISAGVVITGVGVWLWLRNDPEPTHTTSAEVHSGPNVTVSRDQVGLSWSGAF